MTTSILLSIAYKDDYIFLSTDKYYGGFGFLNGDTLFAALVCYGASSGFWGSTGYILSLLFFSPVIVSAAFLFEPFFGQLFGYWMDIDHFPGVLTWVGTLLVLVGVLAI